MLEPFLKWAGGKRWFAASDLLPKRATYTRYIEPFLGGGAIFFSREPASALLSDINQELIDLYVAIRDFPEEFSKRMAEHHEAHCDAYYYLMRETKFKNEIDKASRTLYLNRTCWNGLYRVNLKGKFNVPIGTKIKVVSERDDFHATSKALKKSIIRCCDFEESVNEGGAGDFLFIDPPYTVKHNMNGFVKYNETLFSWSDQLRLRDAVIGAVGRGATVVVTNADHQSVREIYEGYLDYSSVSRASILAGSSGKRGPTTEAIFTANVTQ